jgi:hypothetical protein
MSLLLYIVLKILTFIPYKIICAILGKRKRSGCLTRLLGALVGLACGLIGVIVLITPVCQLLSGGEGVLDRLEQALDDWLAEGEKAEEEYADQWQDQYEGMDIVYAQASISALLQQKFEIAEKEVNVRLEVDEAAERITAVSVGLSGQAVWVNTHELEAYVEQILGCVCTTYIE